MAAHLAIQRSKNLLCLFLYYPGRGCEHALFPCLHAVLIIPAEYLHKCKPLGRTGLERNVKATSLWSFFTPGWVKSGPLTQIAYFLPYSSQGRVHQSIQPKEHVSSTFKLPLP